MSELAKFFSVFCLSLFLMVGTVAWTADTANGLLVGGRCTYDYYNGSCRICSIEQTLESIHQAEVEGGPGYAGYEVRYEFIPAAPLPAEIMSMVNRSISGCSNLLELCNSWYPGPRFLQKYNITEGAVFDGNMSVIKTGTCTPVIIEMKGIDRCDYFESEADEEESPVDNSTG